jgi:RNA polymerase sigma-70 factor, ECF subfamily
VRIDPTTIAVRNPVLMKRKRAIATLADEELMTLVAQKRMDAFELFYERQAGAAYSLAHRIVGDPKLAEDVTQEAFLSVWRSESGYDSARGSVRTWTLGIVRNRAIDAIRRESSGRVPPIDIRGDELLATERAAEETESEVIRRDTAQHVRGVLAQLPAEQARVIELAYFGGFSQAEIAQMLAIPVGTVKGRTRLALEKVRGLLAEGVSI